MLALPKDTGSNRRCACGRDPAADKLGFTANQEGRMDDRKKSLKFKNGKLTKAALPQWYGKAMAVDGDFDKLLSQAGASGLDEYGGGGDTLQIYRTPNDGYLVIFRDTNEIISLVFIDNVADYLMFKAQYIAPLAQLIMAADQHWVWEQDRKKKRA
jgi:hypothetical protein